MAFRFKTTYSLRAGPIQGVTLGTSPDEGPHDESAIAINPTDPFNIVCASCFGYARIGVFDTKDGGYTWRERSAPPSDPPHREVHEEADVAFAADGTCYVSAVSTVWIAYSPVLTTFHVVVYRSKDGGDSWQLVAKFHNDDQDGKVRIAVDNTKTSPYFGTLYAVWGANTALRFGRSRDQGNTWQGVAGLAAGSDVNPADECSAPAMGIGADGTIHVAWQLPSATTISYTRSADGGQSFEPVRSIASNVETFSAGLPQLDGSPVFPGATFRVMTMVTLAVSREGHVIVAWPDMRDGVARIYLSTSFDNGVTWPLTSQELPMVPSFPLDNLHHFMPQLAVTSEGVFGCAFYEYHPELSPPRIAVRIAPLWPGDSTFDFPLTVTKTPWDPAVNPPFVDSPAGLTTYIGDYFGIAGGSGFFELVWTDTATGQQQLVAASIQVIAQPAFITPSVAGAIIEGVTQDGGGLVFVGGHILRIPPNDPMLDLVLVLGTISSARSIQHRAGRVLEAAAWETAATIATENGRGLLKVVSGR